MGMVKRRLYRFLSVVAISAMMATSVVPPSVHATEVDGATETVDEESVTDEGADSEEAAEDAEKEDATEESNGVKEDSKEAESEEAKDDGDKEKSDETCEITYSLEDFDANYGFSGSWGSEVSFKNGVCTLEFSGQYAEKIFGLPEGIKGTDVVNATVMIK